MKCWISAFNAQGSRGSIVGAVKNYVGGAQENKKQGETQEGFLIFAPLPPP
jgi:hypothetical protein